MKKIIMTAVITIFCISPAMHADVDLVALGKKFSGLPKLAKASFNDLMELINSTKLTINTIKRQTADIKSIATQIKTTVGAENKTKLANQLVGPSLTLVSQTTETLVKFLLFINQDVSQIIKIINSEAGTKIQNFITTLNAVTLEVTDTVIEVLKILADQSKQIVEQTTQK